MSQSNLIRSGRTQIQLVSGDTYLVWADNIEQARQKLHALRFDLVECPVCETYCDCVEDDDYLTAPINAEQIVDDYAARLIDALNSDAILIMLDTYLLERITQIIEGTK